MLLYSFTITPNNRKVEAFVKHFDLPVEVYHVNFRKGDTKTDEYFAINPMRKVPALVDGDLRLWESNAILVYLAARFPETNALPESIEERADVDRWLHWQSCHLMPAMGALKVGRREGLRCAGAVARHPRRATRATAGSSFAATCPCAISRSRRT